MERIFAIVDGYTTARQFAIEFAKYNIKCVHVQSSKSIPNHLLKFLDLSQYIANFMYDEDLGVEDLLKKLKLSNWAKCWP